ncbi:hypothetical protein AMJ51_02135 [Microgenomates bacterium DG_75]|nr:MAG: hypothetical protein AMJ51_02135 [Microgenomates bacterium DG_75]
MGRKAILRTLAYADIFDYPLTSSEVWRFLIGQKKVGIDTLQKVLKQIQADEKQIEADIDFYFLAKRRKIIALRKKRQIWSRKKMKIARRAAGWLKLLPSIKMVAVTGALAMENSDKDDDIDLLIITAENRLWLTRLLTVLLIEMVAQRRRPGDKQVKDKICLNMFLDESHLRVPKKEQDLFAAHEVCQLKPIWERIGTYQKFIQKNQWVKQFLPNWRP